jgi:hypothetical protein
MLATFAKHGQNARIKSPQSPALTHKQIMLAFANDVLNYTSAQLNIHYACIGLTSEDDPCPCDDCRGEARYPAAFYMFARDVVIHAEWMENREKLAQEMLNAGKEQQFRLQDREDAALAVGIATEAVSP